MNSFALILPALAILIDIMLIVKAVLFLKDAFYEMTQRPGLNWRTKCAGYLFIFFTIIWLLLLVGAVLWLFKVSIEW